MSMNPQARVADLIFGKWKSRILYAGVRLGIIEALQPGGKPVSVDREFVMG